VNLGEGVKRRRSRTVECIHVALAGLFLITAAGCDGPGITGPSDTVDVRPYVTGAAAANLGPDLLFTFPVPTAPSTLPIISAERARDLARANVLSYGPALSSSWQEQHGRAFDFSLLQADSRAFYASSPYELFPEGFHPAVRRTFGPYYLVRMSSGTSYPLMVAVSAYNTHVTITPEGKLHTPGESGMEFLEHGIPADSTSNEYYSLLSPEAAVVRVALKTGVRISEIPEHVLTEARMSAYGGLWKLTLERPVRVRVVASGRTAEVSQIYVGREKGRQLLIPAAQQPTEITLSAPRIDADGEIVMDSGTMAVRPGQPTLFEQVVPLSP
jgi:hypothetical protein